MSYHITLIISHFPLISRSEICQYEILLIVKYIIYFIILSSNHSNFFLHWCFQKTIYIPENRYDYVKLRNTGRMTILYSYLGRNMDYITIIADKRKQLTSLPCQWNGAWIHTMLSCLTICQNLDNGDFWHSLQKLIFLGNR